jgi:hypothetical protein
MAVKILTRAIIPIAIINAVSEVRNLLPAIDCNAIEIFSLRVVFTGMGVIM